MAKIVNIIFIFMIYVFILFFLEIRLNLKIESSSFHFMFQISIMGKGRFKTVEEAVHGTPGQLPWLDQDRALAQLSNHSRTPRAGTPTSCAAAPRLDTVAAHCNLPVVHIHIYIH